MIHKYPVFYELFSLFTFHFSLISMARTPATKKRSSSKTKAAPSVPLAERIAVLREDERARIAMGLFTLLFSIYLLIAFFSYLFTWKQDQNILETNWFTFIFKTDMPVANISGKIGALFACWFIYDLFGIASFGFLFLAVIWGLFLINVNTLPLRKTFKYTAFLMIWLSITLSFIFGDTDTIPGGSFGFVLSTWLTSFLGKIGTGFAVFLSLFIFLAFTIEGFLDQNKKLVSKIFKKVKQPADFVSPFEQKATTGSVKTNATTTSSVQEKYNKLRQIDEDDEDITNIVIDLDTNEPLKTVEKRNFLLDNKGREKTEKSQSDNLGFEVENTNTIPEKNITNTEAPIGSLFETPEELPESPVFDDQTEDDDEETYDENGLLLSVEKNKDITLDEFTNPATEDYDPTLELSNYKFPTLELLEDYKSVNSEVTNEELISNKNKIVDTLKNYKIEITKIKATIGPTITLYEIIPAPGVRISKIKNLEDDIALSLAALGIRIIAPMPGRGTIGIEVPNLNPVTVSMRSVITSAKFQESKFELPIALGKTISNETYVVDLTKMPHLLVAGATGQGKSVGLNAILTSLLYKKHPSQVKFVLVDPKKVELTLYERIERHFLAALPDATESIVTDNQSVVNTISSLNVEMDARYMLMKRAKVRNIKEYNAKFIARRLNPQKGHKFMPYIVLVIDEFADLIMTAGKEIEFPIARLAQLARAVGIHLIVATQRPSTNIITGVIKANFPTRLAFKVASMIDSRTILDSPGANQLIGRGDMLITQGSDLIRLQCAFIDTPELDRITEFIGEQQGYQIPFLLPEPVLENNQGGMSSVDMDKRDEFFEDAARLVVIHQQGSTSLIQRKLSIGYNRAGRIIDQLELAGVVGPFKGSKAREVLYTDEMSLEQFLSSLNRSA
jgi:S-DNA-T family DNA segregation ATPase FtsK/SpoIIIE